MIIFRKVHRRKAIHFVFFGTRRKVILGKETPRLYEKDSDELFLAAAVADNDKLRTVLLGEVSLPSSPFSPDYTAD